MSAQVLRETVAWGCRILAMSGHVDMTLGHLSARAGADRIFIKRKGLSLGEVTPDDVILIDLDGAVVEGTGEPHLETALHTEVYRARPDVGAVVHTHPPFATALGATSADLSMLTHDSVLFFQGLGHYRDSSALITAPEQAQGVARSLADLRAVLMANHGVLTVGDDVPWAVYTALTLERAARLQSIASQFGSLSPMSETMAEELFPEKYRSAFVEDYWAYLIRELRRRELAEGMPT